MSEEIKEEIIAETAEDTQEAQMTPPADGERPPMPPKDGETPPEAAEDEAPAVPEGDSVEA